MNTRSYPRALLALFVMALALTLGVAVVLSALGGDIGGFFTHTFGRSVEATFASRAAGVLAVLAALAALGSAYLGWFEEPTSPDGGLSQRGYPRYLSALFYVVTLVLLWIAALALARPAPSAPPAPQSLVAPPPTPAPAEELAGGPAEAPPPPQVTAIALPLSYTFSYPLITAEGPVGADRTARDVAHAFPLDDPDGRVRSLLCGKAWVALAGAASQEGDRVRNEERSRLRASLALARARKWLDAHADDCPAPALIGLDLGQHAAVVAAPRLDGTDTAEQRRLIAVHRALRADEPRPTDEAALAEARAFYASAAGRTAILGDRRYERDAVFFAHEAH